MTLSTSVFAAGADGTSGSPEQELISVTPIDAKSSLACYLKGNTTEVTCIIVKH